MKKMLILGCGAFVAATMMTTANAAVNDTPTQNWQCPNGYHESCVNQEDCPRYSTPNETYRQGRGNHQSRCNNNGQHRGNN